MTGIPPPFLSGGQLRGTTSLAWLVISVLSGRGRAGTQGLWALTLGFFLGRQAAPSSHLTSTLWPKEGPH